MSSPARGVREPRLPREHHLVETTTRIDRAVVVALIAALGGVVVALIGAFGPSVANAIDGDDPVSCAAVVREWRSIVDEEPDPSVLAAPLRADEDAQRCGLNEHLLTR